MKSPLSVFCEGDGTWSMTRCCLCFMTLIVFGGWLGLSIFTVSHGEKHLLDIPWGLVTVVGFGWGVKGWQKPNECDGPPCDKLPGA